MFENQPTSEELCQQLVAPYLRQFADKLIWFDSLCSVEGTPEPDQAFKLLHDVHSSFSSLQGVYMAVCSNDQDGVHDAPIVSEIVERVRRNFEINLSEWRLPTTFNTSPDIEEPSPRQVLESRLANMALGWQERLPWGELERYKSE